ncbi:DUF2332 domain-containing protein [Virgibacillus sp. NKC19-3]|uniref:DUF2332 domain-containing protein n=1 Tax=Virgibacillus saliphilus TaxID=2831674 RepID=UPI001C9B8BEA|nr:DUF2332 domain-containing protein [Virgibacillus sp. NKC19-3]MBY7142630.1 DUF2332 domain-containing protein [Virgibacillus sp. NKC19-3]
MNKQILSQCFRRFADEECKGSSELYEFLSLQIASDEQLLELSTHVREGQPKPNMLFGAVHHLLLQGFDHELKYYYPSVTNTPRNKKNAFPLFKDFCLAYKKEIIGILRNKLVQTNEVRRCAYLYPTFCYAYNQVNKPLAMIEIGTSAGLQLMWDHYSYSYGTDQLYGDTSSNVHITSEVKGELPIEITNSTPPVSYKMGIDLNITDLTNDEEYRWLKSLIWPEHKERLKLFDDAVELFKTQPSNLIEGDGVLLLEEIAKEIPTDHAICIFHTHVANQIPKEVKLDLLNKIKSLGKEREVIHVYNNIWDKSLHLDYWINGKETKLIVGDTDGHGHWFRWKL